MVEAAPVDKKDIKWIQGDGGPLVVLQRNAAARWQGAANFDKSLMQGGNVETDYDAICRCNDGINVIKRYQRDMLVLSDSEWAACFVSADMGEVAVIQWFGSDSSLDEMVRHLTAAPPSAKLHFTMVDTALRLLVGADDGKSATYGFCEINVEPGEKVCEVYYSKEAQLAVLRPR